jgi:hypothetical protein
LQEAMEDWDSDRAAAWLLPRISRDPLDYGAT